MNLSQRDRRAVILGGLLLAALIGYRFLIMPALNSWSEARQRIAFADTQAAGLRTQVTQLAMQHRLLGPLYGEGINQPLATVDEARQFIEVKIAELLRSNGLEVSTTRLQPMANIRELPGVATVALQVQANGQPAQIAQCLAKLGESERIILVQKLSMTGDSRRRDRMELSMVVATLARTEAAR